MVSADQHLGRRFGGGVRAAREERIGLATLALLDVAVDLIGAHLQEAGQPQLANRFQQDVGAVDVRLNEATRVQ